MRSRYFVLSVLAIPGLLYVSLYVAYLRVPALFHFRAWELFDILVYNGWAEPQQNLTETGDSARKFLIQRYIRRNRITVTPLGNRIACYDPVDRKRDGVLMLGDSQLFGSGLDDNDTFPMQLCRKYGANIYNGARRNEFKLLGVKEYHFSTVIFTATERFGFRPFCSDLREFRNRGAAFSSVSDLRPKPSLSNFLITSNRFLSSYLKQRLGVLLRVDQPIDAPSDHLIKYQEKHTVAEMDEEVSCAATLADYFRQRHIDVGFLYFPAHQTIYGDKIGLQTDEETRNFVSNAVAKIRALGLPSFDSKECLFNVRDDLAVYQIHDSHLSGEGFRVLVDCLDTSDLASLLREKPRD